MKQLMLDKWQAYLAAQAFAPREESRKAAPCAVTLSRETGAGAGVIGRLVMEILEGRHPNRHPWAMFDRELVAKVLADHRLPETLGPYMPEDARNRIAEVLEELLGAHPSSWTLVQRTNQTILRLAMAGNVILIGRGAHLVTAQLPHVLHVRIVAPLEFRVRHVMEQHHLKALEAAEFVRKGDIAKARYIRRNFESRVQDPLQFHLTINTGRLSFPSAARLIAHALSDIPD